MTMIYVLPADVRVGDRIPNLTGDGPAVLAIGEVEGHEVHGDQLAVTVEGEDEPRLLPVDSMIGVVRVEEPEPEPAERAPAPA